MLLTSPRYLCGFLGLNIPEYVFIDLINTVNLQFIYQAELMAKHRYPLENVDDYKGTITFIPVETITPLGTAQERFSAYGRGIETASDNIDPRQQPSQPTGSTTAAGKGSSDVPSTTNGVTLYLPQAITISDGATYENLDLGIIGGTVASALEQGAGFGGAARSTFSNLASVFTDLINNEQSADQSLASLAVARIAPGPLDAVAKTTLRVTTNPNKRVLFNSVRLREFTFTFKMIATSAQEARQIESIIRFFRTELYPDVIEGAEIIGYKFPNKFLITMKYNNQQVATRIGYSYLSTLTTTYNPSSMGWHVDGKPSEVDLSLTFNEERTLDKRSIAEGY